MGEEGTEAGAASNVDQYLTYTVGNQQYGVRILSVREIRGWETVARVPNTPAYMKGILNLRGTAVPVVDLRMRLAHAAPVYDATTVLIVLGASIDGAERIAGIVVDSVSDVMNASGDEIHATPDFGEGVDTEFVTGLAEFEGNMVMLFDVDAFMRHADIYDSPIERD